MIKQVVFSITLLITLGFFTWTALRIRRFFELTRPAFRIQDFPRRLAVMAGVALGQTKIFRRPVTGTLHALVFWGFCVIAFGTIEMVFDGITGTERSLHVLGPLYSVISASGDIFGVVVALSILVFLFRRLFLHVRRFEGIEMKRKSHLDANLALTMILLLMVSLIGMNAAYCALAWRGGGTVEGLYPFSSVLARGLQGWHTDQLVLFHEASWWTHILLIFLFANILPYSKHFHVFMSIPNVFLSRLEPLGKLPNMDSITKEVRMMMFPESSVGQEAGGTVERFGIKDAEDITWKNYLDSLACTECGRCTAVCPANLTGKRLSPRKIMMDVRARMKEKGPGLIQSGPEFQDGRSLLRDFIHEEELWACTTCNACARECPININHPVLIVDMRRYLVMEEASAPGGIKSVFSNIENNGAPWQYSPEERLNWTRDLSYLKN